MNDLKHLCLSLARTVPLLVIDILSLALVWTGNQTIGLTILVSLLVYVLAVSYRPSHRTENLFRTGD